MREWRMIFRSIKYDYPLLSLGRNPWRANCRGILPVWEGPCPYMYAKIESRRDLLAVPDEEAVADSFLAVAIAADEQEVDVRICYP